MQIADELNALAEDCERAAHGQDTFKETIERISKAIERVAAASSNSWIGYQSRFYYRGFNRPPAHDHFSMEWGFSHPFDDIMSSSWVEVDYEEVHDFVMRTAENPDTEALDTASAEAIRTFGEKKGELVNILTVLLDRTKSTALEELRDESRQLTLMNQGQILDSLAPEQYVTRDMTALQQGSQAPHHARIYAWLMEKRITFGKLEELAGIARRAANLVTRQEKMNPSLTQPTGHRIFIGHGGSPVWKDLKDFIKDRLHLEWDEFNRESAAGKSTKERLLELLNNATFAFLVMTAEDEHADEKMHARENVIHEAGLFQGRLGFERAIILLEEDCEEFSNIHGLVQIRFPKGKIKAAFEDIREVLEREGVIGK
jgi:predicted nucleotide-binding protein